MRLTHLLACAAVMLFATSSLRADDIVKTASNAGNFNTLLKAAEAADLVGALQGDGPITVFAPSDEAFAKIPQETIQTLLKPENKDKLAAILTYHVVPGAVKARDIYKLDQADTLNGQRLTIDFDGASLSVSGAKVVATDIETDNGIIHVIDTVMIPSDQTIPEVASGASQFQTLLKLATEAGLVDALQGDGPLTVFAPTDEAFAKLPKETLEALAQPENRGQLQSILKYHVVAGRVFADQAVDGGSAPTLQGQTVTIDFGANGLTVNDVNIVATDIQAKNGVIHVIDEVLLPRSLSKQEAREALEDAVRTGARLFNHGDFRDCCNTYVNVCSQLVSSGSDLPNSSIEILTATLERAEHISSSQQRAWILRQGIDLAYFTLN